MYTWRMLYSNLYLPLHHSWPSHDQPDHPDPYDPRLSTTNTYIIHYNNVYVLFEEMINHYVVCIVTFQYTILTRRGTLAGTEFKI